MLPQEPKPFTLYALSPIMGYAAPLAFSALLIGYGIRNDVLTRDAIARWIGVIPRITLPSKAEAQRAGGKPSEFTPLTRVEARVKESRLSQGSTRSSC